jgi:hypothetical protein
LEQLGLGLEEPTSRKLDVLETTAYARCPREYFHRWIERSTHTASGTLVVRGRTLHNVLSRWMALPPSARTPTSLVDAWRVASGEDPSAEVVASLTWWASEPLSQATVQMAERTVQTTAEEFRVKGRLDAVLEFEDRLWIVDYKLRREPLPATVIWDQAVLLAAALRGEYGQVLARPITLAYVYFEEREIEALDCGPLVSLDDLLSGVLTRARRLDTGEYAARPGGQCSECGARWGCDVGRPRH